MKNLFRLLFLVLLIGLGGFAFATEPHDMADIKFRVTSQNIKKRTVTVFLTIKLSSKFTHPKYEAIAASIDIPDWGLQKVSGYSSRQWSNPRVGKIYSLKATYKILVENKIVPVGYTVRGEERNFTLPIIPEYTGAFPPLLTKGALKIFKKGKPICGLKQNPRPLDLPEKPVCIMVKSEKSKEYMQCPDNKSQEQLNREYNLMVEEITQAYLQKISCDFQIPTKNK